MSFFKDLSKAALSKSARLVLERGGRRAAALSGEALESLDLLAGRARDSAKAYWQQTEPWRQRVRAELVERLVPDLGPAARDETKASAEAEVEEESQGVGNPDVAVQLFTKNSCPVCTRAKRLLESEGIEAEVVAIDEPVNAYLAPLLLRETEQGTVPYVYIRGEFIGGFDELDKLQRLGQLEARILRRDA